MLDWRCMLMHHWNSSLRYIKLPISERRNSFSFLDSTIFLLKSSNIFHGKIRCMLFIPKSPLGFGRFHLGKKRCHGGLLFGGFWLRTPNGFTEFWGEKNGMFRRNHKKGCSNLKKDALFRNVWRNLLTSVSNVNILERTYTSKTRSYPVILRILGNSSSFRIGKYIIPNIIRVVG